MAKTGATTYSISFYQKDGAFVSDRTVDLNGKVLHFAQGGNDFLLINPTTNSEEVSLFANNITAGGNFGGFTGTTTANDGNFLLQASFDNSAKQARIEAVANTTSATIAYTADTHTFNGDTVLDDLAGNGAGVVAVDNAGLLSWAAAGGGSFGYPEILLAQVFS